MPSSWLLPRRTFLKSASACIALPFLDAMVPANPPRKGTGKPPVRLAWLYVPNGVVQANWNPTTTGVGYEMPSILKPLEAVKNHVLVLSDFAALHCLGEVASHEPTGGGILTGLKCKHSEEPEVGGPSIDQVAARMIGDQTPVDALTLGIDPGHRGDHGYSGTYMSHMSWRSATTPAALEMDPKELFDRLFQGRPLKAPSWDKAKATAAKPKAEKQNPEDRVGASILDLVREDARKLMGNLGSNDRAKMEGYLDGIRSIERRLDLAEKDSAEVAAAGGSNGKAKTPGAGAPPDLMIPTKAGKPAVYADHVNLMLDLLTMAFWTDTTRIGTFMFSFEKSARAYPELGAPGSHHSYSHHNDKPENLDPLTKINTHHMTLFARMLSNMAKLKEGDGTLLDNVAIMYGSGIGDGNKHTREKLPILLAGGGGGAIKGGSHIAFGKQTPICNLYLDMMAMAGLEMEKFGDSTGRLAFK
ncbi:MAG TPA: DUF1552 domain-containing protein [Planctomycetota bacterium]|nr:DUF1552 domain-containing protein [Planctomycetota bacterium]